MNNLFLRLTNSPDSTIRRGYTRSNSGIEGLKLSVCWAPFDDLGEEMRGLFDSWSWTMNSWHSFCVYDAEKWHFLNVDPDTDEFWA